MPPRGGRAPPRRARRRATPRRGRQGPRRRGARARPPRRRGRRRGPGGWARVPPDGLRAGEGGVAAQGRGAERERGRGKSPAAAASTWRTRRRRSPRRRGGTRRRGRGSSRGWPPRRAGQGRRCSPKQRREPPGATPTWPRRSRGGSCSRRWRSSRGRQPGSGQRPWKEQGEATASSRPLQLLRGSIWTRCWAIILEKKRRKMSLDYFFEMN